MLYNEARERFQESRRCCLQWDFSRNPRLKSSVFCLPGWQHFMSSSRPPTLTNKWAQHNSGRPQSVNRAGLGSVSTEKHGRVGVFIWKSRGVEGWPRVPAVRSACSPLTITPQNKRPPLQDVRRLLTWKLPSRLRSVDARLKMKC